MMRKILVAIDNLFYRKIIKSFLKLSKLGHGFVVTGAEAGTNYEHIYDDKSQGRFLIGKIVDRMLLNLPAVKATKNRKDEIKKILWNEINNNKLVGIKTKILDLASGGARYLREFNAEHIEGTVESICIDKNPDSVSLGKTLVVKENLKNIKFFKGDIFNLNRLKNFSGKINWIPNIIVASGFFIYLNNDVVEQLLREIYKLLPINGIVVFSSYEKLNTKKLMRKAMKTSTGEEWTLYYREPSYWRETLNKIGYKNTFILRDQWQMNNICFGRK